MNVPEAEVKEINKASQASILQVMPGIQGLALILCQP